MRRILVPNDLDAIQSRAPEADPRDVGMTAVGREAIWHAVEDLYRGGLHPAISLTVRKRGKIVVDRAIGYASGYEINDRTPSDAKVVSTDTPYCIFSASKAITAIVMHWLEQEGHLHLSDRVVEYLPEYGAHRKEWTTIRHVLTHRAGIPTIPAGPEKLALLTQPKEVVARLCDAEPTNVPGRRLSYHAITGGFILGEIVERVTGKTIREVFDEAFAQPLGLEVMRYGAKPEDVDRVARSTFTGGKIPFGLKQVAQKALGVPFEEVAEIANTATFLTPILPAANVIANGRDLSAFFQLLLDEGRHGDQQILEPRTVHRALNESSYAELDLTLLLPIRYGQGLVLGDNLFSLYGPNTPRAFGHLGFINMLGWADPDRDVAAALLTSGKPFLGPHLRHFWNVLKAISRETAR